MKLRTLGETATAQEGAVDVLDAAGKIADRARLVEDARLLLSGFTMTHKLHRFSP
jgi:hypothetical protein